MSWVKLSCGSRRGGEGGESEGEGGEREEGEKERGTNEDLHSHKVARLVDDLVPVEDGLVDDLDAGLMAMFLR